MSNTTTLLTNDFLFSQIWIIISTIVFFRCKKEKIEKLFNDFCACHGAKFIFIPFNIFHPKRDFLVYRMKCDHLVRVLLHMVVTGLLGTLADEGSFWNRLADQHFSSQVRSQFHDRLHAYEVIRFKRNPSGKGVSSFEIKNNLLAANLHGYGQHFYIVATRIPTEHLTVETERGEGQITVKHFQGHVRGRRNSLVQLYVYRDRLLGHIQDETDHYQLEYLRDSGGRHKRGLPEDPAVVMYRKRDIKHSASVKDAEPIRTEPWPDYSPNLVKRQPLLYNTYRCKLRFTVDFLTWKRFYDSVQGTENQYTQALDLLTNEMTLMVMMANNIWRNANFVGIVFLFKLESIKYITTDMSPGLERPEYDFEDDDEKPIDELLIEFTKQIENKKFCAAIMVVGRPFPRPTGYSETGLSILKTSF